ncbi:YhbY family RNA-binding protein [Pediococcus inopinatus]|uniref:YhbY family RNA-binding protein n=1 Tax=Pediococcus inopinatus TaxID=114090 RepID=A0ABZ0Q8L5_9LACO|nr:YhbY family RNA-binding protein [Pediococcus inopinatus]AVK99758.1 RNA-binding protein [Pediococcus inopinatus]WPC17483.1 YhbY family RNA-binding protein [Pediococcus inopinatus]WPC18853.1 YhbY family RNA-binding protein [Pediococcus inopinatus]WPC22470.1 YhbY family RNA-binding protein [Pediococcus inopinatus]WPP08597.1 YhbY family RNA-binding protein [Pediococcus inopinatus]
MNLRGKQKRFLRSKAQRFRSKFSVGKNGLTEAWVSQLDAALNNYELIKINLQQNTDVTTEEVKAYIEDHTNIQVVQMIGHVLVLFKESDDEDKRRISAQVKEI